MLNALRAICSTEKAPSATWLQRMASEMAEAWD